MDFGVIALDERQQRFAARVCSDLSQIFTADTVRAARDSGDCFSEPIHCALGARGWLMPTWSVSEGGAGLDVVENRLLELELARRDYPWIIADTTKKVWGVVERYGAPEITATLKQKVAAGSVRFCLGYSEPDGGSDIASARLRAQPDGESWVLNGTKTFTTGAHVCQYVFLLTRTDPDAPKHRGMTTFLVPLNTPGIEIAPMWTYGGERTNTVSYNDVRVPDRLRLGDVNAGWEVVRAPLDEEHSVGLDTKGLHDLSVGRTYLRTLERALDVAVGWALRARLPDGTRIAHDSATRMRLGKIAVAVQAAIGTPGPGGRVVGSDTVVRGTADVADLMGALSLLVGETGGVVDPGFVEFAHRFSHGTGIYGGTVEVFRSMIAAQVLGLPKPSFPGSKAFLRPQVQR